VPLLVLPLLVALLSGCEVGHSWSWRQADLDRNRFNLAMFRGADTGQELADWAQHGQVVAASGTAEPGRADLQILVRYTRPKTGWFGSDDGVEEACYQFTSLDGHNVAFDQTDC